MRWIFVLLVCGVSTATRADAEHDRIRAERSAADTRLADQERECATRFIVAPCVEAARAENRTTLTRLRQQELQLDDGIRRAAAEARRKAIADKVEAQQARASDAVAPPPRVHVRRDPQGASTPPPHASDAGALRAKDPVAAGTQRASAEQRSEQAFEARARAARAHKEAVERRNAQRAAQGKEAPPLPAPVGGSAAR